MVLEGKAETENRVKVMSADTMEVLDTKVADKTEDKKLKALRVQGDMEVLAHLNLSPSSRLS